MGIILNLLLQLFRTCQTAPGVGKGYKIQLLRGVLGQIGKGGRGTRLGLSCHEGIERFVDATIVGNVFTKSILSIQVQVSERLNLTAVLVNEAFGSITESLDRFRCPPGVQIATFIVLATFIIETVSELNKQNYKKFSKGKQISKLKLASWPMTTPMKP